MIGSWDLVKENRPKRWTLSKNDRGKGWRTLNIFTEMTVLGTIWEGGGKAGGERG